MIHGQIGTFLFKQGKCGGILQLLHKEPVKLGLLLVDLEEIFPI